MYEIKEMTKIIKMYTCICGAQSKFEFETDLNINGLQVRAKCQNCEKEIMINFGNSPTSCSSCCSSSCSPSSVPSSDSTTNEIIDMSALAAAATEEYTSSSQSQTPPISEGGTTEETSDGETEENDALSLEKTGEYGGDVSTEEERALADLFGKL